jgi:predicted MFS family arabinose efflux permease
MRTVALAFAVLGVGGSASDVGLVLACGTATLVVALLAGGVVADRVSRRAVMVACDLVRAVSQGLAAGLLIAGAAEVWMLAALAAVAGVATGFFRPAETGLFPAVVPPEGLQRANGMRATAMSVGEIGGPLVAGVIVVAASPGWAIAGDAASFAVSALLLTRLRVPRRAEREPRSFVGDLRDGWDAFRSRTWVWTVVATTCVANVVWGAWSALGPVVAHRHLGGAAAWGVVLGVMGAGTLAGGLVAAAGRLRRPLVTYSVAGAFCAPPLAALAAGVPVAVVALAALVAGAALMLGNSTWYATLQRHVPGESLSRVSSYDELGSAALYPIGLAIWGPIATGIGFSTALWIAFAVLVVTSLSPLIVPEVRHMRA